MDSFFSFVADSFNYLFSYLWDLIKWIFEEIGVLLFSIFELVGDVALFVAFSFIDLLGLVDHWNSAMSAVPPTALYFINASGVPEAISMLLTAYLARFVITLIPGVG